MFNFHVCREEAGVVQEIVKEISLTLFSTLSSCTKGLIGISKRLKELISKIRIESKDGTEAVNGLMLNIPDKEEKILEFYRFADAKELPLKLDACSLVINGCLDLETLPKTLVLDYNPSLSFLRCFKLVENHNNVALTILKKFLQEASNKSPEFGFTLPGSEILEWFGHQSNGCSIKIESLPSFFNDNEWAGFAFCIVFVLHEHVPVTQGDHNSRHYCRCSLTVDDQTISTDFEFRLEEYSGEALPSHLWISYMSHSHNFVYQLHKLLGEDGTAFELFFEAFGSGLEIEKCGIRLLYKSDVEELIHQGTGSIDEENHTLIKRKHEEDNEEDELGGNDRCDENPPHPKRFKRILDFFTWGGQSS
ncbi:hypothetical protein ACFE04_007924 [Oxalis oulophora]